MESGSNDASGPARPPEHSEEYYFVPEEGLQYLPKECRDHYQAIADDGHAVLSSVDKELSQMARISASLSTLVSLKHIKRRLAEYRFAADMEAILELDMLTTAFVVTYVRLHQGGSGSGFARDALPPKLREVHDAIVDLRNKRFAHNDEHHSVSNGMEIGFSEGRFDIKFGLTLGYHVGGATEWHELVDFLDSMVAEKMGKILARLQEKTGREWTLPSCPAPKS